MRERKKVYGGNDLLNFGGVSCQLLCVGPQEALNDLFLPYVAFRKASSGPVQKASFR